ncbi:MAG: hypothetical protein ACHQ02_00290 [Candidatus Limnocylindrales bacterium]
MDHSIAAKYAARPAAHFVRPSARTKERRLGLHPTGAFRSSTDRATVLRRSDLAPLVSLRGRWRSIQPATISRAAAGPPKPRVEITWSRSGRASVIRRSSAATAPWHA